MSCPHPAQFRAGGHTHRFPGLVLMDQQTSADTDVGFQTLGFKKPLGNLTGAIKNVSLRAAACHKLQGRDIEIQLQ